MNKYVYKYMNITLTTSVKLERFEFSTFKLDTYSNYSNNLYTEFCLVLSFLFAIFSPYSHIHDTNSNNNSFK